MTPHPCTVHNSPFCQAMNLVNGFKHAMKRTAIDNDPQAKAFIRFALLAQPMPDDEVIVAEPRGDGHRARFDA